MRLTGALVAAVALAGCGASSSGSSSIRAPASEAAGAGRIELTSPAFTAGGAIPRQYTCDGQDLSPPLRWSGVPGGARELTLRMRDPDAPGGNFVHWSLTGIRPTTTAVAQGQVPPGAVGRRNSFGTVGYRGPCPPGGPAHHYVISLTALKGRIVLASGTLVGSYARR